MSDISDFDKKTSFSKDTKFFILGEFNDEIMPNVVYPMTKKIEELCKQRDASIEIYINSNGGNSHVLESLLDLVELAKAKDITVKTIVSGRAYSCGSMLAITGTPGHRYISRFAEHLPHYGTVWGWSKHTPVQLEREHEHHKRHFEKVVKLYEEYTSVPNIREHMKDDNFFIPADKSIKWKVADKYFTEVL